MKKATAAATQMIELIEVMVENIQTLRDAGRDYKTFDKWEESAKLLIKSINPKK